MICLIVYFRLGLPYFFDRKRHLNLSRKGGRGLNPKYESTTVKETNDRLYTHIDSSSDATHHTSKDGKPRRTTWHTYENAEFVMHENAKGCNVNVLQNNNKLK